MPARVQSVERAAAILQVLSAEHRPTSLAQLADTLGLAKATVHGLVQTLRDVGFVDQDPESGLYAVGAGLLQLGATALDHNELRSRAINWADALAGAHRPGRPARHPGRGPGRRRAPRVPAGRQPPDADRDPAAAARRRARQGAARPRPPGAALPGRAGAGELHLPDHHRPGQPAPRARRRPRPRLGRRGGGGRARGRRAGRADPRPRGLRGRRRRRGRPGRRALRRPPAATPGPGDAGGRGRPVDLARARARAAREHPVRRRDRPGHHLDPLPALRPGGADGLGGPAPAPAVLPAAGLGRARRRGDLADHPPAGAAGAPGRRGRPRAGGRAGGHQPARDHGRLGPGHRPSRGAGDRVAGHPDRRGAGRARRAPRPRRGDPADRAAALVVPLGPEAALDPRQRPGDPRAGRARRAAVRDHGHLAGVEALGRPARHRRHQRQPHPADGPGDAGLGPGAARGDARPGLDAAGDPPLDRGARRDPGPGAGHPDQRGDRRPAGLAVRPDRLRAGPGASARSAPAASC